MLEFVYCNVRRFVKFEKGKKNMCLKINIYGNLKSKFFIKEKGKLFKVFRKILSSNFIYGIKGRRVFMKKIVYVK